MKGRDGTCVYRPAFSGWFDLTGILTVNEAVERLRYHKVNSQVSFHTEKALRSLQFVDIMQEKMNIDFVEALEKFYSSDTYRTLQNTENGLCAIYHFPMPHQS